MPHNRLTPRVNATRTHHFTGVALLLEHHVQLRQRVKAALRATFFWQPVGVMHMTSSEHKCRRKYAQEFCHSQALLFVSQPVRGGGIPQVCFSDSVCWLRATFFRQPVLLTHAAVSTMKAQHEKRFVTDDIKQCAENVFLARFAPSLTHQAIMSAQ